jgi:peroxiredoxin
MLPTICFLTCALATGQVPDGSLQPQLARGQELVYSGTFTEEWLGKRVQTQHVFRIDATVLVMDATKDGYELAFLTVVTAKDSKKQPEPGSPPPPSSVRLEVVAMDKQGKLQGNTALSTPLEGPPTIECGVFVEVPKGRNAGWWETNEPGRPPRTWKLDGNEMVNNVKCVRLVGIQQSEDWAAPRADSAAWQRCDTVWVSPQLGVVCRFERVLEQHAPASDVVAHRSTLRCEYESGLTYFGKFFDQRVSEIKQARKLRQDSDGYVRDPEQHKTQLEGMLKKIKQYTDSEPATTNYRKAIVQVQKRVEAALRGETIPDPQRDELQATRVAVGQRVPDFVGTDLLTGQTHRLLRLLGKPIVVFFYNPSTDIGRKTLELARTLAERYPKEITLLPLAVTDDVELVQKQHKEMKLPFPILDGNSMHQMFGVDALPRFVVLDGEGVVRLTTTGWGPHTPAEVDGQLQRWMKK